MDKKKKLSLGVDRFSVIDDFSDDQLAIVEIWVCHDGNNLHDMPIDLSVIKQAKKTLKNKFLVAGFDGEDFEGHEPDEQIVGFFPESSKMTFEEKDGKTYLVAQAIMSKVYAKWAYDVFVEDNSRAVSMEIVVLGSEVQDDGLEHITKFVFSGVTLLGETHLPACEGTNASIIKFSLNKENALKVYSKHFKKSDEIKKDFIDNMRLADNFRKEDLEQMEKEKDVKAVDEEMEKALKASEEEQKEDETTYMDEEAEEMSCKEKFDEDEEEETEDDKDADIDDKEEEEKEEEKKTEEEDEDAEEEDMECKKFESLTVEQKYEVFRSAVRESLDGCGYLESFDDEYVYVYDYCEGNTFRYAYTLDGTVCTIDKDSKERVMRGGYVPFEAFESQEVKMEALKKENCGLKDRLAAYEKAEKDNLVEGILSEVVEVLTAEKVAELREKARDFSLDELSAFENEVKALAFEAVKTTTKKYSFERMPADTIEKPSHGKYGWSK